MESVDAAVDATALARPATTTSPLTAELLAHVREDVRGDETARPLDDVRRHLGDFQEQAGRRPGNPGQEAALDLLGDAIAAALVDNSYAPGEARAVVVTVADLFDLAPETVAFGVFRRALASRECIQLPPRLSTELILSLLVELAPAEGSSLWATDDRGATTCLASAGETSRDEPLRRAAQSALDGLPASTAHERVHIVERWERPYAALVACAEDSAASTLDSYLAEAATALAPLLERVALFERNAERERELVAAGERRLIRVGFDLHDGPLQALVALAEELRSVRSQVDEVVGEEERARVRGRFLDLEARLEELDTGLRRIAHSIRSTTALEQPVEHAVRRELDALASATAIETELTIEGDVDELTNSQKIVIFRVVQEALSNVRKHSGAETVSVAIHSTRSFVDVMVTDDGCGFDLRREADPNRLGLAGVSERVRLLGGSVEIASRPGEGTAVRATLPQWRPLSEPSRAAVYAVGP